MPRFIAADASPLIGLAIAGVLDLLRALFGTVTITRTVKDEIVAGRALPGARELEGAMREGWIRVAPAPPETWKFQSLGAGEASTIALALALAQHAGNTLVLMDDALGREQAVALGLQVTGLAGLLAAAHRARLIDDVRPFVERLTRRGFIIPADELREVVDTAAQKSPTHTRK